MATIFNVYIADVADNRRVEFHANPTLARRTREPRLLFPFNVLAYLITSAFAFLEYVVSWFVQRVLGWLIQRWFRPRSVVHKQALTGR